MPHRWPSMRGTLKFVMLMCTVLLWLGGVLGHDLAMAQDPGHATMTSMAGMMDPVPAPHDHCGTASCKSTGQPCCVMGQCLIGIPATTTWSFRAPARPTPVAAIPLATVEGPVRLPYRPPT